MCYSGVWAVGVWQKANLQDLFAVFPRKIPNYWSFVCNCKTLLFAVGMVVLVVVECCPLVCGQVALQGVPCSGAPTTTLHISRHSTAAAAITNPLCHQVAPALQRNLGLGLTWGPGLTGWAPLQMILLFPRPTWPGQGPRIWNYFSCADKARQREHCYAWTCGFGVDIGRPWEICQGLDLCCHFEAVLESISGTEQFSKVVLFTTAEKLESASQNWCFCRNCCCHKWRSDCTAKSRNQTYSITRGPNWLNHTAALLHWARYMNCWPKWPFSRSNHLQDKTINFRQPFRPFLHILSFS